jgi:hypothetical protein
MTFMANDRVKNGVPEGQILKLKEPYRVVPHMKALDEHFLDLLNFWRYDVIWWRNDVKSFVKKKENAPVYNLSKCMPEWEPESMHARIWGGLLQDTVSPMGDMVHSFIYLFIYFFVEISNPNTNGIYRC